MKQRTSQILFDYWNKLRGERVAPHRFEIEPARIASILPETFILELVDRTTYRFRLAGTRMCEQFGVEFRGTNFLDLWIDGDRRAVERQLASIAEQGAVGVLIVDAATADGRCVQFEVVLLPLVHAGTSVDRVLGAISAIETIPFPGVQRLHSRRLVHHELIWPDGPPRAPVEQLRRPPTFLPQLRGARLVKVDRRQFRVYDGGLAHMEREKQ
jgi:hypothetical protein